LTHKRLPKDLRGSPADEETKLQARALWEGNPSATAFSVAKDIGRSRSSVLRWMKAGNWRKLPAKKVNAMAQKAADNYNQELSKLGPEITAEQKEEAASKAIEATAVEVRAAVLERHRKEWAAPRSISYEAIKERNFDKAKLAKITAETLLLIQSGERKAYGMDAKDPNPTETEDSIIVIERD